MNLAVESGRPRLILRLEGLLHFHEVAFRLESRGERRYAVGFPRIVSQVRRHFRAACCPDVALHLINMHHLEYKYVQLTRIRRFNAPSN